MFWGSVCCSGVRLLGRDGEGARGFSWVIAAGEGRMASLDPESLSLLQERTPLPLKAKAACGAEGVDWGLGSPDSLQPFHPAVGEVEMSGQQNIQKRVQKSQSFWKMKRNLLPGRLRLICFVF